MTEKKQEWFEACTMSFYLDVPLMTFVIFWTVLSVMDSVLESFGDLAREERESEALWSSLAPSSLSPPRKELDFFNLLVATEGWGDGGWDDSFARAPNSCKKSILKHGKGSRHVRMTKTTIHADNQHQENNKKTATETTKTKTTTVGS